jgi:hypothetical protein
VRGWLLALILETEKNISGRRFEHANVWKPL